MKTKTKQHDRETKLLIELQDKHGYSIMKNKPRDQSGYWLNFKTGKGGLKYCLTLYVPLDSALAIAMKESDKPKKAPKRKAKK